MRLKIRSFSFGRMMLCLFAFATYSLAASTTGPHRAKGGGTVQKNTPVRTPEAKKRPSGKNVPKARAKSSEKAGEDLSGKKKQGLEAWVQSGQKDRHIILLQILNDSPFGKTNIVFSESRKTNIVQEPTIRPLVGPTLKRNFTDDWLNKLVQETDFHPLVVNPTADRVKELQQKDSNAPERKNRDRPGDGAKPDGKPESNEDSEHNHPPHDHHDPCDKAGSPLEVEKCREKNR